MVDWIKTLGTLSFMAKGAIINTVHTGIFPLTNALLYRFFLIGSGSRRPLKTNLLGTDREHKGTEVLFFKSLKYV